MLILRMLARAEPAVSDIVDIVESAPMDDAGEVALERVDVPEVSLVEVDGDAYDDDGVVLEELVLEALELVGVWELDCASAARGNVAASAMRPRLRI